MKQLIIFDWSGVISDDRPPVYEANMRLLEIHGRKRVTFEEWLPSTQASAIEFLKMHKIKVVVEKAAEQYRQEFNIARKKGIHPLVYKDAVKSLRQLFKKRIKMVVISTHPAKNLVDEAKEYGVNDLFEEFFGSVRDKAKTIKDIVKIYKGYKIYYVGDTVFDIQAAKKAKAKSIAITNGYHVRERLEKENPDIIVESLTGLLKHFKN